MTFLFTLAPCFDQINLTFQDGVINCEKYLENRSVGLQPLSVNYFSY